MPGKSSICVQSVFDLHKCAASAWMYSLVNVFSWRQAGTGQSHEMRVIFRRLSAISQLLLHAYFVFDGPDRPQLKRGKDIICLSGPRLLAQRFQELLTAFGFNWHAPGEAEAELAYLQSLGLVDTVATPDNDALLFGATCVIRRIVAGAAVILTRWNCSIPHIGRYEDVYIYTPDAIEKHASLEWGDLLLVALMSCTDDNDGHRWCSVEVARRLAYYGVGRTLLDAAVSLQFVEFMNFVAKWRVGVCKVLRTDPQGLLGGRRHELARIIEEERIEFPDPAILAMYLLPLTSWSDGRSPVTATTSRQPDLQSVAAFCLQRLSWSPAAVQSELMDVCAGTVMRALLQVSSMIAKHVYPAAYSSLRTATGQCRQRGVAMRPSGHELFRRRVVAHVQDICAKSAPRSTEARCRSVTCRTSVTTGRAQQ
ncbi:PIN domain-like protein [Pisolithus sp. B1]|nr:PIN domain-like protein [Pisolithus sp. B1]